MAILEEVNGNKYEVRIKRYPDNTYFEEHVKLGDREKQHATTCDRYIVAEKDVSYFIEATLHKGFKFGDFDLVQIQLCLPDNTKNSVAHINIRRPADYKDDLKEDLVKALQYADVRVAGKKMEGARFVFRGLELDESLSKETDVMGVNPQNLGHFEVSLHKVKWENKTLTDTEYNEKLAKERLNHDTKASVSLAKPAEKQHLWDACKVDEDSFKKDGISYAVGFVGGCPKAESRPQNYVSPFRLRYLMPHVSRVEYVSVQGPFFYFKFHYRTAEFLQVVSIIKYPPPLYVYGWTQLDKSEKMTALRQLQEIDKTNFHEALEAKSDKYHVKMSKNWKVGDPNEWRAWNMMGAEERKFYYKKLQESKKAYDRGEVPDERKSRGGKVISLIDDESDTEGTKNVNGKRSQALSTSLVKAEGAKQVKIEGGVRANAPQSTIKSEPGLANDEPVAVSAPVASATNPGPADTELERKIAKAKRLAEEIEREQDALEDEIAAARASRAQS